MYPIIDFVIFVFNKLVDILNTKFFDDINITFLQVILGCIALKYVIKFLFGGFKEIDTSSNFFVPHIANNMGHSNRKSQVIQLKKSDYFDVEGNGSTLIRRKDYGITDDK